MLGLGCLEVHVAGGKARDLQQVFSAWLCCVEALQSCMSGQRQ
jgi:hypothetical protein